MRYKKKPVVIEALQWNGENFDAIVEFVGEEQECTKHPGYNDSLLVCTLEGDITAGKGDFIIKGVMGEIYPCREDIFRQTYEEVN